MGLGLGGTASPASLLQEVGVLALTSRGALERGEPGISASAPQGLQGRLAPPPPCIIIRSGSTEEPCDLAFAHLKFLEVLCDKRLGEMTQDPVCSPTEGPGAHLIDKRWTLGAGAPPECRQTSTCPAQTRKTRVRLRRGSFRGRAQAGQTWAQDRDKGRWVRALYGQVSGTQEDKEALLGKGEGWLCAHRWGCGWGSLV